ncbi:MAG: hypothetical protein NC929_00835, partial [Candidatus Omnitrophica bacterium]|nr:hypothetical protein [Candidatus Omnitrophota bacterium]
MTDTEEVQDMRELGGAKWIWGGDNPRPVNSYRYFRKEFSLKEIPESAEIIIFAEFRYKLYINGRFIQTGPTLCQPAYRLVDRYRVLPYLQKGKNCVGVIVYCPGVMTGQWTLVNPALIVMVRIDNGRLNIPSDRSWKTLLSEAWVHPTQFCGYAKGFHEWHRIKNIPDGWDSPGFEDKEWANAFEMPFYAYGDTQHLKENYVGYPTLYEHLPLKLIKVNIASGVITDTMRKEEAEYYTATRNRWLKLMGKWNIYDINTPLEDEPLPEPVVTLMKSEEHFSAPEDMLIRNDNRNFPVRLNIPSSGHPSLVFDLGTVKSGMFILDIESESGGTADIGWDDRIDEDGRVKVFRSTPNCDRVEVPAGRVQWNGFFERGARYLQIVLRGFSGKVTIYKTGIKETLLPLNVKNPAVFSSDNGLLNLIWKASMETVRQYMNGCAAGDPVRERCHWLGDDTMAMRIAFYCFGEKRIWHRALELTAQSQNSDGSFPVISPGHF